jgi:NADH:ubiquinone oxidoreductase subunit 6 (subunit J)
MTNFQTKNSIQTLKNWKPTLTYILNIVGALLLASLLTLGLTYVGLLGELSSQGIFILWQKFGSYILPTMILILSLLVVILSNPIYALICLILVFFNSAVFLLSINVNFLAMIYLIIYIGAIAILFLFVIMMFNLRELKQQSTAINDYSFLSISFSLCFLVLSKFYALLLDAIMTFVEYDKYFNDFAKIKLDSLHYFLTYQHTDTLLFGTLLYDYYSYLFLLAALILLTSMLGSIILALSTTEKTTDSSLLASTTP